MKRFNKFLALFLAVVMTVGLLPAISAVAANPNVLFEEDFEDYTTLGTTGSNYETMIYEPYYGTGTGAITTEPSEVHGGSKAVKLTPNDQKNNNWPANNTAIYANGRLLMKFTKDQFEKDQVYKVTAWVKSTTSSHVQINLQGTPYTAMNPVYNTDVDNEWTQVELEFTMGDPAALTSNDIAFRIGASYGTNDPNACLMIDDIKVFKVVPYGYQSVVDELAAGNAVLQTDINGTGNDLVLKTGKTLDLAGYTLTVDSLSAMPGAKVIDSVGGGKIVVANDNLTLQGDNGMMPIKTNEGYVLSNVKLTNNEVEDDGLDDIMVYETRPSLGAANNAAYLADGAADNGLSIIIRLTWTNASNGTTTTMDVPCSEELIKDIYGGTGAFRLLVKGVDGVENLKVATVITSTTGVTCVSVAQDYTAPAV